MILIPNDSNSYCIDSERPSRANLVAWYGEFSGKDILPPKDVVFTIIPALCFLIIGITACITRIAPKKFRHQKAAPFDSAAVAPVLRAAGAEVLSAAPSLIRFRDNYGITLEAGSRASEAVTSSVARGNEPRTACCACRSCPRGRRTRTRRHRRAVTSSRARRSTGPSTYADRRR